MSKPKREPTKAEKILGWGGILFLVFLVVKCATPSEKEKQQAAAMKNMAQEYVTGIEMDPDWESVTVADTTDGNYISVSITYNITPRMQTVIDDTMTMARAILTKLILNGYAPTADNISVTVHAFGYQRGETGTVSNVSYGRARYSAIQDNLEFKLPE